MESPSQQPVNVRPVTTKTKRQPPRYLARTRLLRFTGRASNGSIVPLASMFGMKSATTQSRMIMPMMPTKVLTRLLCKLMTAMAREDIGKSIAPKKIPILPAPESSAG